MHFKALFITFPCSREGVTKTLMVMKITAILILMACLQVCASGYSQVTLSGRNMPLLKVFRLLKGQTGYDFLYDAELVRKAGNVDMDLKNVSLEKALDVTLKGTSLAFTILDRTVVIKPKQPDPISPPSGQQPTAP